MSRLRSQICGTFIGWQIENWTRRTVCFTGTVTMIPQLQYDQINHSFYFRFFLLSGCFANCNQSSTVWSSFTPLRRSSNDPSSRKGTSRALFDVFNKYTKFRNHFILSEVKALLLVNLTGPLLDLLKFLKVIHDYWHSIRCTCRLWL